MIVMGGDKPSLEELSHFGVKGMRWGVRKKQPTNSGYTPGQQRSDRESFGKGGVRRINNSLNKGLTRQKAQEREANRRTAMRFAKVGALVAGKVIISHGAVLLAAAVASRQASGGVSAISSKAFDLPYVKPRGGVYNITTF